MKITFLGAAHEVTGSLTFIELNNAKLLVDCGMEQGRNTFENQTLPVSAAEIDCVLLTHAHIDHSGNLPLLYKQGFRGTVYATRMTCNLSDIMLRDSAHIQEAEAEWRNRKKKRAAENCYTPIYTMEDAEGLLHCMRPVDYGEKIRILEGVEIRFVDIGHLLGSAAIEVFLTENGISKKFVFSGDVGNINKPILKDPTKIKEADYVMIESTYGDRLHDNVVPDHIGMLADVIQTTLDRGGNVVIPSFAVGRTQEILYLIRLIKLQNRVTGHGDFRVVLDSPLAQKATGIFLQADVSDMDEETAQLLKNGINPLWFNGLELCESSDESRALNFDTEPKVIISASGMCEAGRIRHHLKHNLWRSECTILFAGYQAEGTLGRLITEGVKYVKLFGEKIAVRAEIKKLYGTSGHADKNGLINWLSGFEKKPEMVFVNHGEDEVCAGFAETLKNEYGYNTFAPYSGTVFDLADGSFVKITSGIPVKNQAAAQNYLKSAGQKQTRKQRNEQYDDASYNELITAANRLMEIAKAHKGSFDSEKHRLENDINKLISKWK